MIIYPAIDIRGGKAVRLIEGDFKRETVFDADPADAAKRWADAGAEWIHVVDLDGSLAGESVNSDAIARICASHLPVQLGGGLRSVDAVESAFSLGVTRAIIGTAAIHDRDLLKTLSQRWPGRIAVGLDARDGNLAGTGWTDQTAVRAIDVAVEAVAMGVAQIVFTDIRRDGKLAGPNLAALSEMVAIAGDRVIASGGVGTSADVDAVRDLGAGGLIIGRALYDGRVDLADAISRARSQAVTA